MSRAIGRRAEGCVYRYRIAGLTVSSDIEIPGLHEPADDGQAEVSIRLGEVPETLDDPASSGPTWALAEDVFLLRVPGIARFLLTNGNAIVYQPGPKAQPGDIGAFVTGAAFGVLLHQRGLMVLHASSVSVNGRAALFMGPSGAGKSTLAAALLQRGYPLVTDDFCAVGYDAAGRPLVYPDSRLPKLWANTIRHLGLADRQRQAVRGRISKFHVEPTLAGSGPSPLLCGPVYALAEARGPATSGISRPNVVDAALLLRQNAYRTRLIGPMRQGELYFRLAAAIGNAGGVFQLTRDLDFEALPAVVDDLERHWSDLGQLAGAA
jgi:hypothetical protein